MDKFHKPKTHRDKTKYNRKEKASKENLKTGKNGKCDTKCKPPRDKIDWIKMSDLPNGVVDFLHKEYLL